MQSLSLCKYFQTSAQENDKMIKLIKKKLTPLSQNEKYPMGKNNFLHFKNLQKLPKLKKQHFNLKSRKSQHQEQIMNELITKQLDKTDKKFIQQIYERPTVWLKLWKNTGDKLQNQYYTNRQKYSSPLKFPQQTRYPENSQKKFYQRNLQHSQLTNSTNSLLKKVQIYKKKKNQQILEEQKISKSINKNSNLQEEQQVKEQQEQQEQQNQNEQRQDNNNWVHFITKFIFSQHVPKTQEDKLFQQYKSRKQENNLRYFIDLFQDNKKEFKSCHISRNSSVGHSLTVRDQLKLKDLPKIQQRNKNFQYQQKQNEILSFNYPTIKLKKLKSICNNICLDGQDQQTKDKNKFSSYSCSKLRMNSNHKKIIETNKFLSKA